MPSPEHPEFDEHRPAPGRRAVLAAGGALVLPAAAAIAGCVPPQSGNTGPSASDGGGGTPRPPSEAPDTPAPSPAEIAAADMSLLSLSAQLVLVGVRAGDAFPADEVSGLDVGGFFLLGRWTDVPAVVAAVADARDAVSGPVSPLLAVDQEGGEIRMLRGDAARSTPSAEELGAQGTEAVREAYRTIGEDLSALGLHVDLAPVADVVDSDLGDDNAPVGALGRGFGTDPELVADCVASAVEGLDSVGIAATLKHFPGLGRVRENTDFSDEDVTDTRTAPGDPFLDPFAAGIEAGAGIVMTSSAVYEQIDAGTPAMFSREVVTTLLREEMGFDGLVVTDDIGAATAVAGIAVADRARRVLEAGGDAVLTADPAIAGELVEAIAAWAEESPEQEERVRDSARRLLALKDRFSLLG